MADFFAWAGATPAANLLLVAALGVLVLTVVSVVLLCIVSFFRRIPFRFFGFEVWTAGVVYETGVCHLPADKPASFYLGPPGDRALMREIAFTETFSSTPRVLVALGKIDVGDGIARLQVSAEEITRKGFTLRFRTWENSKVFDAAASWLAIGR